MKTKQQIDDAQLVPTDPLMQIAWRDCLMWAVGTPEIMEQFRADTGCNYRPPASVIEQMIDESTGYQDDFVKTFVRWFNANIWGDLNIKARVRELERSVRGQDAMRQNSTR